MCINLFVYLFIQSISYLFVCMFIAKKIHNNTRKTKHTHTHTHARTNTHTHTITSGEKKRHMVNIIYFVTISLKSYCLFCHYSRAKTERREKK